MVSWNDAADSHDSVASDALVMPMSSGRPSAGRSPVFDHAAVRVAEDLGVDTLARQEPGGTRLLHADPAGHLAHDELDVLVGDRHTLVAVDPLHFLDEVQLRFADALDLHDLLRIEGTIGERLAGLDVLTVGDDRTGTEREHDLVLLALIVDDDDRDALALVLTEAQHTGRLGETGRTLRGTSLEQLDDAGQTAGDVLAGHTTGVEGTHRQLGAGLADRLGGDDADGLAELDHLAGGERTAVAHRADAEFGVAREHRADPQPIDARVVAQRLHLLVADDGVARQRRCDRPPSASASSMSLSSARPNSFVSRYERRLAVSGPTFSIHTPSVEPQSSSRTISSWATSTRRRVR